jgi:16S rRNA (adenine1518-N6/adenine1519-N6)-dimethyltransferase
MIKKHNIRLSKKFGQNFLTDERVLKNIINCSQITKEDIVLEVGPGAGTLTRELCKEAGYVLAIEIDRELKPVLEDALSGFENCEVIIGDAMKQSFEEKINDLKTQKGLKTAKIVANLPYYITTPLIMKFLEEEKYFESMTFMIQKEVGERMVAKPGKKTYGALSVAVQYYTIPNIEFLVSPNSFFPEPEVNSCVVKLQVYKQPAVKVFDETLFFKVIKAAFGQRRKTLSNALANLGGLGLTKEKIIDILVRTNILPNQRGETLSVQEFANLSNFIKETVKK